MSALAAVSLGAVAVVPALAPSATTFAAQRHGANEFSQKNLVSNLPTVGAQVVDEALKNPWGLADGPTPLWIADNNGDAATIYTGDVDGSRFTKSNLTVAIPGGAPTGQVYNPTTDFVVSSAAGSAPAKFIFSSEAGQIAGWSPTAGPSAAVAKFTSPTAVYKALAIGAGLDSALLYATNFHDGTVDVFDTHFHPVVTPGGFHDRLLPKGYAPFGIQQIHGLMYVSYALQNDAKHDDLKGPGHGFIDVFTTDGFMLRRLASRGALDSPWGMTTAPAGFGPFAGKLLVGNFGDGRISVFDPFSGEFLGQLRNEHHRPIVLEGLWGLLPGNGIAGDPQAVLFSAGIHGEKDGLVGALTASK